jgi:hypothetical protein
MRAYGEVQVWFHEFVAQIVGGGEWSGSRLGARKLLPLGYEAGWVPGTVGNIQKFRNNWSCLGEEISLTFAWNRSQISCRSFL